MSRDPNVGKRSSESDVATFEEEQENNSNNDTPKKKKQRLEEDSASEQKTATICSTTTTPTCSSSTLYVSNLHTRISEPHLQKLFQRFGEIVRINLIRRVSVSGSSGKGTSIRGTRSNNHQGGWTKHNQHHNQQQQQNSYTYAFVEFKTVQSAIIAMQKVNGITLLGMDLLVRPAHAKGNESGIDNGEGNQVSLQSVKKQCSDVESKIDALRKTLMEKQSKLNSNK